MFTTFCASYHTEMAQPPNKPFSLLEDASLLNQADYPCLFQPHRKARVGNWRTSCDFCLQSIACNDKLRGEDVF